MKSTPQRLDDLVREKIAEPSLSPLHRPPFGFETAGDVIPSKQLSFHSLEFLHKYRGVTSFGADFAVMITVPPTRTGIVPLNENDQPYRWTGKINEKVAKMAVWWAFDLLTEGESREFLGKHSPEVVFQYMENRRLAELRVVYDTARWLVV